MMRFLITAFDPFGGEDTNSSEIVLNLLPQKVEDVIIDKKVVPTVYNECGNIAFDMAVQNGDCCIIALGQAGKRKEISVEAVGINYALAKMPDNKGRVIYGDKLYKDGKTAYFSTLPVKCIADCIADANFPCQVSSFAGGFVCNSLLYTVLKRADEEKRDIRCVFIHLPYAEDNGNGDFFIKKEDLAFCITEAVKCIRKFIIERNNGQCAE
ncbi:MAG: pyroglutamyl-peptidase I [Clostridia bacterium]